MIRFITLLISLGICIPFWFSKISWFPGVLWSEWGLFLIGFVPPIIIVIAVYYIQAKVVNNKVPN